MSHYKHFTTQEREKTMVMLARGASIRVIARELSRSPSTICREISRNTKGRAEYSAMHAQRAYKWRRRKCRRKAKLLNEELAAYVIKRLKLQWSPEQIVGRAKLEGYDLGLSYATIYRAVAKRILPIALHKEMRIKRRRHNPKDCKTGKILDVLTIHDRPETADYETGHWESDTVRGKRGSGDIATHVERKTGYLLAIKLKNLKNGALTNATNAAFAALPEEMKRSFTVDRGVEFIDHERLTELTGMPVYFCDAGCPGQRGLNENTNGLLRQYFRKGTSFKDITQELLDEVVALINNRPRKRFGFLSPNELFSKCCT